MKSYDDPAKSPVVQDIVMSNLIGMTVAEIASRLNISPERAFKMFYESETCKMLHDKSTGLYLQGHLYIADEFMLENQRNQA